MPPSLVSLASNINTQGVMHIHKQLVIHIPHAHTSLLKSAPASLSLPPSLPPSLPLVQREGGFRFFLLSSTEEMAGNLRQPKEDISGLHDGESMPKVMELVVLVALRNCRYKINLPGFKKSDSCLHKVTLCVNRLQC